ncbi:MAG: c-type cytochrome [Acidobacteriota bacterium]
MRMFALPLLLVAALAAVACGGAEPIPMTLEEALHLPRGDVEAGHQAFLDLRCHYCHAVTGDETLPEPMARVRGTEIGPELASQSAARLAESIIDPSHEIPPPRNSRLSPMGDFSEAMTVRQLIDLITYIQSIDG